ncbi:MAG: hypothetical protein GPJ54_16710 [Candidatus Heimdallarchaeota archaeon]|nr:hypothetical protein [Candidatus Heimdallarchaeota archaeon]
MTGLMHLAFAPTWFEDEAFGLNLGVLFIINGIGYFALLYLLYFGDQMKDNKDLVTYLLGGWTVATILGWILYHPGDTLLDSSISNKIIEVLLLVFLYLDFTASEVSVSATPAAESTTTE